MNPVPSLFRHRRLPLAVVSFTVLSACQAILGLDDPTVRPGGSIDGGEDATPPGADGGGTDAESGDASTALSVTADKQVSLYRAASAALNVVIARGPALRGPITVKLSGLTTELTADPLVLAEGETSGALTVRATALAAFGVSNVRLEASSEAGDSAAALVDLVVRGLPGAADTSFVDTVAQTGLSLSSVAALPGGRLIVAGSLAAASRYAGVARLLGDGKLDKTYGVEGRAETLVTAENDVDLAVDELGNAFIVALRKVNPPREFYAARFDATGKVDPTFSGTSPFQALYGSGLVRNGVHMYLASTAISATTTIFIGRLSPTGFDSTYGTAGFLDTAASLYSPRLDAIDANGGFLVVAPADGDGSQRVVRLKPDGALDSSFGGAGAYVTTPAGDRPRLALLGDGRIAVTGGWDGTLGTVNGSLATVCLSNGTADPAFTQTPAAGWPRAIVAEAEDRIVVVGDGPEPIGTTGYHVFVHRAKANGGYDAVFNAGKRVVDPRVLPAEDFVRGAILDSYRRLVVITKTTIARYWL